jgi:cold shock CspA family protein
MNRAAVKWFRHDLQYGFLTDASGRDYFLSGNILDRDGIGINLVPGLRVMFDATLDRRGRGWRVSRIALATDGAVEA